MADGEPEPVEAGHPLDDSAPDLRMQPHYVPLVPAQWPWLQQDPLAYPELADVAEQRREHQLLPLPGLQVEALPYGLDVGRDLA